MWINDWSAEHMASFLSYQDVDLADEDAVLRVLRDSGGYPGSEIRRLSEQAAKMAIEMRKEQQSDG